MSDFGLGVYAIFDTTLGEFTCRLFADKAPETVANFRGLAEGTKEFVDSKRPKPRCVGVEPPLSSDVRN